MKILVLGHHCKKLHCKFYFYFNFLKIRGLDNEIRSAGDWGTVQIDDKGQYNYLGSSAVDIIKNRSV